ncbi:MAG: hypothetical protein AAFV49_17680, partial [Pseudomonadota bacterium]
MAAKRPRRGRQESGQAEQVSRQAKDRRAGPGLVGRTVRALVFGIVRILWGVGWRIGAVAALIL